jgi:Mg/Co/Ni transporter MgtE
MEPEEAADVKGLLAYHEKTAGGLMTPEFIAISPRMTCKETIKHLRKLSPKAETIYYVYVVDDDNRLLGVISLRDLIVSAPATPIADIMVQHIRYAHTGDSVDEVARIVNKYNLLALPVVDESERLVGIVMVDDVMDQLVGPEKKKKLPQLTLTTNRFHVRVCRF